MPTTAQFFSGPLNLENLYTQRSGRLIIMAVRPRSFLMSWRSATLNLFFIRASHEYLKCFAGHKLKRVHLAAYWKRDTEKKIININKIFYHFHTLKQLNFKINLKLMLFLALRHFFHCFIQVRFKVTIHDR